MGTPAKKTTVSGESSTGASAGKDLAGRYEQMRGHVLGGSGRDAGLSVFLRQGMRAWMEAGAGSPPAELAADPIRSGAAALPPQARADVVLVMAAMILSNHLEMSQRL